MSVGDFILKISSDITRRLFRIFSEGKNVFSGGITIQTMSAVSIILVRKK